MSLPSSMAEIVPCDCLLQKAYSSLKLPALLYALESYFIVIGLEQANLSLFFYFCTTVQIKTGLYVFFSVIYEK